MLDFQAAVNADWTPENQSVLRSVIQGAYGHADEKCDVFNDPDFETPNRQMVRGYLRWSILDVHLKRACDTGLLTGIGATWVRLKNGTSGCFALELRGSHTALIAHHIQRSDDPPRESALRFERMLQNRRNPMLPGFEQDEEPNDNLINLTLVHGDKEAEFAFLRVYTDPENPRTCIEVSRNLMAATDVVVPIEEEPILEPELGLRSDLAQDLFEYAQRWQQR